MTLAGLEKLQADGRSIDWHSFRHTVATTIAERRWSELQLPRFMGWETASIARQYVDLARIPTDKVANDLPDPIAKSKKRTKRGRV